MYPYAVKSKTVWAVRAGLLFGYRSLTDHSPFYRMLRYTAIALFVFNFSFTGTDGISSERGNVPQGITVRDTVYLTNVQKPYGTADKEPDLDHMLDRTYRKAVSYRQDILSQKELPEHVRAFFFDTSRIDIVHTALMEQARFDIPASITVAQAIVESDYMRSNNGNNLFGIKAKKGDPSVTNWTREWLTPGQASAVRASGKPIKPTGRGNTVKNEYLVKDSFRKYRNYWESVRGHSLFLKVSDRYAPLFQSNGYREWAYGLEEQGYATDPQYAELLLRIIYNYDLSYLDTFPEQTML